MNISSILSIVGWGLLGILVLYVLTVSSQRAQRQPAKFNVLAIVVLLLGGVGANSLGAGLVFIDQFESGVVISPLSPGGVRTDSIGPGLHWIFPFIESVERFSIAKQEYTMSGTSNEGARTGNDSVEARSSDGQQVYIDATVRYFANSARIVELRRTWRSEQNYVEAFIRPTTRNIIYNTASRYKVEEIYGVLRAQLQQEIQDQLSAQFEQQGLVLDAFQLRNVTFSPEYAQSIELKQIAQQQSEQAKLLVQKAQQEADQVRATAQGAADAAVTKAKGDAEALRQIAAALKDNPELLMYTYIQKLAPNVGLILLPAGGSNPFIIDLKQLKDQFAPAVVPSSGTTLTPALP